MKKNFRQLLRYLYWYVTEPQQIPKTLRVVYVQATSWLKDRRGRAAYPHHSTAVQALYAKRTSDTIFIFGAGASLHDITAQEWRAIDQHNTVGWHLFSQQSFVHADIYIFRETHAQDIAGRLAEMRKHVHDAAQNPCFQDTLWAIQAGWKASNGNLMIGHGLLPTQTHILRFVNSRRGETALPTETFEEGLAHGAGTLTDAVNLAYHGGWKKIVLIGVDLYDTRYFTRGPWEDDPTWVAANPDNSVIHPTARHGIVDQMALWVPWLNHRGVEIYVYNPRSLMTQVMPIYPRPD